MATLLDTIDKIRQKHDATQSNLVLAGSQGDNPGTWQLLLEPFKSAINKLLNLTNNQILIGNSTGDIDKLILTAGDNVSITKDTGAGTLTIAATGTLSGEVADGSITTAKLADFAVTGDKINNSTIGPGKLDDDAVVNSNIAAGAVGQNQIADGAVVAGKIAAGVVGTTELADGSVTSAKLAAGVGGGGGGSVDPATNSTLGTVEITGTPVDAAHPIAVGDTDARMTNSRTPTSHHASHQHGGADEIGTAIPTANAIPKAGSDGKLDIGWLPSGIGTPDPSVLALSHSELAYPSDAQFFTGSGGSPQTQKIKYPTTDYDPNSAVSADTDGCWKFTAPSAGFYAFSTSIQLTLDGDGGGQTLQLVHVSGSTTKRAFLDFIVGDRPFDQFDGFHILNLAAGDTVQIEATINQNANIAGTSSAPGAFIAVFQPGGTVTTGGGGGGTTDNYKNAVLADSPLAYYRLNETSGTTATDLGSAATNATYGATVQLGLGGPLRLATGARSAFLDGQSTSQLNATIAALPQGSASRSIEIWCKLRTLENQWLFGWGTADYGKAWAFLVYGGNLYIDNYGTSIIVPIDAGNWHHIVATYDGTTVRLYVDGALVGSSTSFSLDTTGTTLSMGGGNPGIGYAKAFLAEGAVYSTVLTQSRVISHFLAGQP